MSARQPFRMFADFTGADPRFREAPSDGTAYITELYERVNAGDAEARATVMGHCSIIKGALLPHGTAGLLVVDLLDRIRGRLNYEVCGAHIGVLMSLGIIWQEGRSREDARVGLTPLGCQL